MTVRRDRRPLFNAQGQLPPSEQVVLQRQLDDLFRLSVIANRLDEVGSVGGGRVETGSILVRDQDGWRALPPGAAGQVLTANGPGAIPTWQ